MKYIDAEKLKAEIERRRLSNRYITTEGYEQELYELIDSLQQEQPANIDNLCSELADFLIRNDIQEDKAKFLANRIADVYGSRRYLVLCNSDTRKICNFLESCQAYQVAY